MRCPKWLGRAIRPLYAIRGRIVSRSFIRPSTRLERAIRWACERVIDWVELWEMQPAFEALNRQLDLIRDVQRNLEAVATQFGIELPDPRSPQAIPTTKDPK